VEVWVEVTVEAKCQVTYFANIEEGFMGNTGIRYSNFSKKAFRAVPIMGHFGTALSF